MKIGGLYMPDEANDIPQAELNSPQLEAERSELVKQAGHLVDAIAKARQFVIPVRTV